MSGGRKNTKIGHFIEKSVAVYDLNVDDISGFYFIDDDNEEVFLNDSIHTKFFDTISVLLRQYQNISLFTITTSRHLRTPQFINKFRREYKRFINNNSQLTKIFTHHKVKYPIDDMLKNILIILKTGISYRDIQKHTFINWNTIYSLYGRICA